MCPIYVLLVSKSPKFHSVSFYDQPFFEIQAILRQVHRMTHIDHEPYKVKLPYICKISIPESQISLHFALRSAVFELQVILRQVHRMIPK